MIKKFDHYPLRVLYDKFEFRNWQEIFYNDNIFLFVIDDCELIKLRIVMYNGMINANGNILRDWVRENILKEYFKNV
jgi:hypothetical protein